MLELGYVKGGRRRHSFKAGHTVSEVESRVDGLAGKTHSAQSLGRADPADTLDAEPTEGWVSRPVLSERMREP